VSHKEIIYMHMYHKQEQQHVAIVENIVFNLHTKFNDDRL